MSIIKGEHVIDCQNEFESVLCSTEFCHALIKTLNKKDQQLKSKHWIKKGIIVSINNLSVMFKSAVKDQTKRVTFKEYRNLLNSY